MSTEDVGTADKTSLTTGIEGAFALQYPAEAHSVSPILEDHTDPGFAFCNVPWCAPGQSDIVTEDTLYFLIASLESG